jgi:hypothetical protein
MAVWYLKKIIYFSIIIFWFNKVIKMEGCEKKMKKKVKQSNVNSTVKSTLKKII